MNPLRNPGFRRELGLFCGMGLILSALGWILSPLLALGILIGVLCSALVFWLLQRHRFDRMRALSAELSEILHGSRTLRLDDYREGELAILRSELQKLLNQLQTANDALRQDRAMLADSLADISHQLRTPMTSMELIVTLLRSPATSEEKRRELLRDLNRLLDRTVWLIEALLKLSRLDAGMVRLQPDSVSLRDLVERAAEPLDVAMELREQTLELELPESRMVCDPLWTVEALGNLLKNAMEHTPPGGRIRVSARSGTIYTEITVRDSGPGFDPEDLPHLFERFYKGKNADAGSFGIGLALTRRILSEQDCTIQAANHPEGGAVFTLRFYHSTV